MEISTKFGYVLNGGKSKTNKLNGGNGFSPTRETFSTFSAFSADLLNGGTLSQKLQKNSYNNHLIFI